jgi:small nuclear ribonucleoprotein (snRNP)-like protein
MHTKIQFFLLTILLVTLALHVPVNANTGKDAKFAAKVKTAITEVGIGSNARVDIKLRNKRKIKGYVTEKTKSSFVVMEDTTGLSTEIPYSQVKQIKGKNNLTGEEIALVTIGAAVVLFALLLL